MTVAAYLVFAALAALFVAAGYLLGLRRFTGQAGAELDQASAEIELLKAQLESAVGATQAALVAREDTQRTTAALRKAYAESMLGSLGMVEAEATRPEGADGDAVAIATPGSDVGNSAGAGTDGTGDTGDDAIDSTGAGMLQGLSDGVAGDIATSASPGSRYGAGGNGTIGGNGVVGLAPSTAMPTIVHSVLLDGMTNSGKSTLLHRLVTPWMKQHSLATMRATERAYRTRPIPVGFEWSVAADGTPPQPRVLHALRFHDISGENSEGLADHVADLDAERRDGAEHDRQPPPAIALWVWDMADTMKSRTRLGIDRLRLGYHNKAARLLFKHVVVFFNKIDLLPVDEVVRLIALETEHVRSITGFFGNDVTLSFLEGSALDGRGMIECYGTILGRLGLSQLLRPFEEGHA